MVPYDILLDFHLNGKYKDLIYFEYYYPENKTHHDLLPCELPIPGSYVKSLKIYFEHSGEKQENQRKGEKRVSSKFEKK